MRNIHVFLFIMLSLASVDLSAQVDRIELGYQTTKRGIVWYRPGLPTHAPTWKFSRDTNAVLWVDTLTAIRYDWDYSDDRWRAKGTFSGPLPPRPQQTSGAALVDNRTAFWIRDTFNLLHKYDSTANAWTPLGDFFFLSSVPTDIAATGSNGAAKYRRSLWQDADDNALYYFDGATWVSITAGSGDDWGAQVAETDATLDGDGTIGTPLKIAQQAATSGQVLKWNGTTWLPANDTDTDTDAQNLTITGASAPFTVNISGGTDVNVDAGTGISLAETPANTLVITNSAPDQTVSITNGGGIAVSGTYPAFTLTAADQSATNELQTLTNSSAPTTHTLTLSSSGGSMQLSEGTGITLTTTGTALDGVVTIASTATGDGNGVYGDGTAGSGDDTLPIGGSTVTIPGQWQPLQFNTNTAGGQVWTALRVNAATCADDRFTKYLVGKSPADSIEIYNFDCGSIIKATGGQLTLETNKEMILNADSFYMATVPEKTTLGGIVGFTQYGSYLSQIKGTATDQVLKWNNTGSGYFYMGTDNAGSGTLTGAENGLSVVSNKVRLGGNLITTATSIEGDGNELRFFDGKLSVSSWTGYANTPVQPIRFQALEALPTTSASPTLDGIIEYRVHNSGGSDQPNSLTIGGYSTDADGMWMQARSAAAPNFNYPISMQPRGGMFSIGRTGGLDALATFAGAGLTGSTITGNVMHLENTGGNAKAAMGIGVGTDILDSEIGFFDGADALRVTNRNATTGTSSVRIAVGGETSDKVIVIGSSATPNARVGVGHTATTTIKSTLDNKGSLANATAQTTGSLTLTEAHHTVRYTLNSTVTFTLPSASDCPNREYLIHHFGSAGQITLSQNVISSTGTTFNAVPSRHWAYMYSDGADWYGYLLQSL